MAGGSRTYLDLPDGQYGPDTATAVKGFQGDAGLPVDGDPGPQTRKAPFGAYMDWLCTPEAYPASSGDSASATADLGAAPTPFRMQPEDFLGGKGAQAGDLPAMSLQSCGKFNPIVLLSNAEMGGEDTNDGASKTQRNADDAPNRRVIMFLFEKGTTVDAGVWPCPKVKDTNDACKSAFWPDGDSRRNNGGARRDYVTTKDTMACRFYDRFARRSPCEGLPTKTLRVWLHDRDRQRMPNTAYRLVVGYAAYTGQSNGEGYIDVIVSNSVDTCLLSWGPDPDNPDGFQFGRKLNIAVNPTDRQGRDLYNLAYFGDSSAFGDDYPGKQVDDVHTQGLPKATG